MLRKCKNESKILKILLIFVVALILQICLSVNYKVDATKSSTKVKQKTSTQIVEKKSIKKLKYKIDTSVHTYTGAERKAEVKIYDGKKKLKLNKHYTVSYKNNINTGKAIVTIKGIGNYTGTIKAKYYIAPKKNKIKNIVLNSKFTKATITWTKDTKATGYAIYMATSKNGKYAKIKTITNKKITTYVKKGLDPKKVYYFKVRAYKFVDNKKVYSKKYSEPKTNTALIGEVTLTSSNSGSNRNHNLKLASKKINGKVLKPGQIFNWFTVVGPASKSNGYKSAIVFENGKSVLGYGGGVCQVSTTLYQAAKEAKLKIVERHTHSKPVSYTTSGKDATVAYGARNLRIKNNKKYSIKLVTSSKKGSTTCKIYKVND